MRNLILSCFLFVFVITSQAQTIRCGADINIAKNQNLLEKINLKIQELNASSARKSAVNKIIRIPIVVHVIHNTASGFIGGLNNSNISDDQIFSQIEVLNEDYRRLSGTMGYNNNAVGADMEIEFFLANINPQGKPTNGINRVYSSRRSFSIFNDLENLSSLSYWDSNKYLNVWVTTISGNYLGYAEFPIGNYDGLELVDINEKIDGVFVDHRAFGRQTGTANVGVYTFGRTLTHEIGHWLGLIHTWGDRQCGTDFCDDTPTIEGANDELVCTPVFSNCRGAGNVRNMIENYMDYSPDSCMNIFTQNQKSRVRAILEISKRRQNLISNLDIFEPISEDLIVRVLGNPVSREYLEILVLVNEAKDFKVEVIDNFGRVLFSEDNIQSLSRSVQIPKSKFGSGIKYLMVSSGSSSFKQRILSL